MGNRLGLPLHKFCYTTQSMSSRILCLYGVFYSLPACPFSEPLTRQREGGKGMRMAS